MKKKVVKKKKVIKKRLVKKKSVKKKSVKKKNAKKKSSILVKKKKTNSYKRKSTPLSLLDQIDKFIKKLTK